MKRVIKNLILITLLTFVILYLCGVFITTEFDPAKWSECVRIVYIIASFTISILSIYISEMPN